MVVIHITLTRRQLFMLIAVFWTIAVTVILSRDYNLDTHPVWSKKTISLLVLFTVLFDGAVFARPLVHWTLTLSYFLLARSKTV